MARRSRGRGRQVLGRVLTAWLLAMAASLAWTQAATASPLHDPVGPLMFAEHVYDTATSVYDGGFHSAQSHSGEPAPGVSHDGFDGSQVTVAMANGPLSALLPLYVAADSGVWSLPAEGRGLNIGGRWYTEHALERMAPNTPEVMAQLEARAMARAQAEGLAPGTREFGEWWAHNGPQPRGIPPMVVEAEIANPGTTGVRVITNANGDVVTVYPTG